MKKCIILANGQAPKKNLFKYLQKKHYVKLFCADGGANTAFKYGLLPDLIIGDLDSIQDNVYKFYSNKCRLIRVKRQNDTDVEKCLKYAHKNGYNDVLLLAATGDRLDHTFCNLGITLKYYPEMRIRIIHQTSILEVFSGKVLLQSIPNEVISIYGIDSKSKITSTGLKYKLSSKALPFGWKESTSNVATGDKISLKITDGKIFVIRDFEKLRKYDLI